MCVVNQRGHMLLGMVILYGCHWRCRSCRWHMELIGMIGDEGGA